MIFPQHKTNAISAVLKSKRIQKSTRASHNDQSQWDQKLRGKTNLGTMPLSDGRKHTPVTYLIKARLKEKERFRISLAWGPC
ncbi:hypothetical protein CEXT_723601 [Caerostris extrusa]|uniref:Uncharacterized protein n=1 Tax=Caerostris extrusa TaxID=172846 RepID=A0AAV4M3X8_CAEEX|nr:hypothetical protein CEXT_723601 [Caerostris extrusa]